MQIWWQTLYRLSVQLVLRLPRKRRSWTWNPEIRAPKRHWLKGHPCPCLGLMGVYRKKFSDFVGVTEMRPEVFFLVTPFCHLGWVRITVDLKRSRSQHPFRTTTGWSRICAQKLSLALEVMHEILPSYASRCYHIGFPQPPVLESRTRFGVPKRGWVTPPKTGHPKRAMLPAKKERISSATCWSVWKDLIGPESWDFSGQLIGWCRFYLGASWKKKRPYPRFFPMPPFKKALWSATMHP